MSKIANIAISILATPLNLLVLLVKFLAQDWRRAVIFALLLILAILSGLTMNGRLQHSAAKFITATHAYMADWGFALNHVTVTGRQHTAQEDLVSVFRFFMGTPIFQIDLAATKAQIENLTWVRTANVSRILPDRIHIDLNERIPFALWQREDGLALIDRDGIRITDKGLAKFTHLPVFSGLNSHIHAAALMDMLAAYPLLLQKMSGAEYVGQRRWTIHLAHGGAVHLPAEKVIKALELLMQMEREENVLAVRDRAIDLRIEDRVLLRALPDSSSQQPLPQQPLSETPLSETKRGNAT